MDDRFQSYQDLLRYSMRLLRRLTIASRAVGKVLGSGCRSVLLSGMNVPLEISRLRAWQYNRVLLLLNH